MSGHYPAATVEMLSSAQGAGLDTSLLFSSFFFFFFSWLMLQSVTSQATFSVYACRTWEI